MKSRFQRFLLLGLLLVGVVVQGIAAAGVMYIVREAWTGEVGAATASSAELSAKSLELSSDNDLGLAVSRLRVLLPDRLVLLTDSDGRILSGTMLPFSGLPADLFARNYSELNLPEGHYIAAASIATPRVSGQPVRVVVLSDYDAAMAGYQSAQAGALALELLVLALVVAAALNISQHLAAPIMTLYRGLDMMAGANPLHRIKVASGDELETVARQINDLADASAATRAELERQVAEVTRAMDFERQKLAAILFALADGVIVCDRDLNVVLCNRAGQELLGGGWRPARRGKSIYAYVDSARFQPLIEAAAERQGQMKRSTFTLTSGAVVQAQAVVVGEGEESYYLLLLRDITDEVGRDRDVRRARDLALHTMRGSLTAISSASHIITNYPDLPPDRQIHFLKILSDEAEHLGARLDDLQASLILEPVAVEWAAEETDLGALFHQAAEWLRPVADQRVVTLKAMGEAAVLKGDRLSLQQLAFRLVQFGVASAPEGGSVEARWESTEEDWVEFHVDYDGPELSVSETGALFDEPLYFSAGEDEWKAASIEKATIREIIKSHRGEAWAKNREGGVTLAFVLPARSAPLGNRVEKESDTVGKQISALLGDGSFYDFRVPRVHSEIATLTSPLRDLSIVVFDIETTGLRPREGDEIVSIAGVRIDRGELVKEDVFQTLIKPVRPIPPSSTKFHGITDHMVLGKPSIDDVLPKFLTYKGASLLAGHFVSFDLTFLRMRMGNDGTVLDPDSALDTLLLSTVLLEELDEFNLEDIASYLAIPVVDRHTALGDAYITAQLLLRLFKLMEARGMTTLADALRLQKRGLFGRFLRT